jgi:hypothetical protein
MGLALAGFTAGLPSVGLPSVAAGRGLPATAGTEVATFEVTAFDPAVFAAAEAFLPKALPSAGWAETDLEEAVLVETGLVETGLEEAGFVGTVLPVAGMTTGLPATAFDGAVPDLPGKVGFAGTLVIGLVALEAAALFDGLLGSLLDGLVVALPEPDFEAADPPPDEGEDLPAFEGFDLAADESARVADFAGADVRAGEDLGLLDLLFAWAAGRFTGCLATERLQREGITKESPKGPTCTSADPTTPAEPSDTREPQA